MAIQMFARVETGLGPQTDASAARETAAVAPPADIRLSLHDDLAAVEPEWRAFEARADCTVFQTFDWLATWHRHIGTCSGVRPTIVIGRHDGDILFILPLGLEKGGFTRRVTWLGSYLCNYNGPLLAPDFARRVSPERFVRLWQEVMALLRRELRHDLVDLEKMPEVIGGQANPLLHLRVTPHVNDAYLTHLAGTWDEFYAAKRSSATRKTDRKKRKRLAEHGEIRFVTAESGAEIERCLDALIEEKRKAYAQLGVANMFEWPGYRDFFLAMASNPQSGRLTHVSRFDVGSTTAAANFGLIFRERYYYVLAGYDDGELARLGPGSAQLHDLMGYAIQRGLKEFDFTIGDEPYKREWCDSETRLFDQVSPATLRGWMVALPMTAVRQVKRRIKRNPSAWAFVRKVRSRLGALRRVGR
jgi:CelD/BcsL family acetyltransferase involved in cellulose biosynthesis